MLRAQHVADVVEAKQRFVELEQRQVDRLREVAELRACLLEVDRLKGEWLAKDDKLRELVSAMAAEKLLLEKAIQDCLRLFARGKSCRGSWQGLKLT